MLTSEVRASKIPRPKIPLQQQQQTRQHFPRRHLIHSLIYMAEFSLYVKSAQDEMDEK